MSPLPLFVSSVLTLGLFVSSLTAEDVRQWSDTTGHYEVAAELIAYNSKQVVLQKENGDLISMKVKELSDGDRAYLRSVKADDKSWDGGDLRIWTTRDGLKIKGKVLEFASREVKIRINEGKVMVNDNAWGELPSVYQAMVPKIVSHFENRKVEDEGELKTWLEKSQGRTKTYECEGVLFELENGDHYGVPLFLFSKKDQRSLEPAWRRWKAAGGNEDSRKDESFYLRAQARANAENISQLRQIAEVKLQLQAYDAGLYDLWEVAIVPAKGRYDRAMTVVVPGRSSDAAAEAALAKYPGGRVTGIAKLRRRR